MWSSCNVFTIKPIGADGILNDTNVKECLCDDCLDERLKKKGKLPKCIEYRNAGIELSKTTLHSGGLPHD